MRHIMIAILLLALVGLFLSSGCSKATNRQNSETVSIQGTMAAARRDALKRQELARESVKRDSEAIAELNREIAEFSKEQDAAIERIGREALDELTWFRKVNAQYEDELAATRPGTDERLKVIESGNPGLSKEAMQKSADRKERARLTEKRFRDRLADLNRQLDIQEEKQRRSEEQLRQADEDVLKSVAPSSNP